MNMPFDAAVKQTVEQTVTYADLITNVSKASNGHDKASNLMILFKAMERDGFVPYQVFSKYPLPEVEAAIQDNSPLVAICQEAPTIYFCPDDSFVGIKATNHRSVAEGQWIIQLRRFNGFACNHVLSNNKRELV